MGEISDPTETTERGERAHAAAMFLGTGLAGLMALLALAVPHVARLLVLVLLAAAAVPMWFLARESYLRLRAGDRSVQAVDGLFVVLGLAIAGAMLILNAADVA